MKKEVFWIRHGESVANIDQYLHMLYYNPDLSQKGEGQMVSCGDRLFDKDIQIILCSPLKRSIDSANIIKKQIISKGRNPPIIQIIDSLKESGIGLDNFFLSDQNGSLLKDIRRIIPTNFFYFFKKEFDSYVSQYDKILIVGHHNVNKSYIKKLTDIDVSMNNGDIYILHINIRNKINALEDYSKKRIFIFNQV
jgi:broad specificity phosphatase PhoE